MRSEKILVRVLRKIADLVSEEAARSPQFAERLDGVISELSTVKSGRARERPDPTAQLPDLFGESKRRSETDLELWLKEQPLNVLRGIIQLHDFDASKRSRKWTDREKLARLIVEQLRTRMSRGAAFLKPQTGPRSH